MRRSGTRLTGAIRRSPGRTILVIIILVYAASGINNLRVSAFPSTTTWWNRDGTDYIAVDIVQGYFLDLPANTALQAKTPNRAGLEIEDAYDCRVIGFAYPSTTQDQLVVIAGGVVQAATQPSDLGAPISHAPRAVDPYCRVTSSSSIAPRTPAPSGG